ncbi:MAG: Rrf2 family transcriptional regulator [Alphaproteobacteria bacterium]|jgi:Rrf2 family protein|nr:Rrf2 family transcriptional regulator [Alphaproteobacteria bacterium]MDP6565239.1 Rrf2 family transcriptional regulator [Alphaproteobacteria bacterium]MDP6813615.1 Rrf2 family transcriptional regulator [Alphaproteobacteria bacterium]
MRLQKSTLFALYAVLELARENDRQMSTGDIAERYDISPHHLSKVMRQLVRSGLIQSVRGAGGGYRFSGNAKRVTLLDIIDLFEPSNPAVEGDEEDPAGATSVARALDSVRGEIDELTRATLQSITLRSLLKYAPAEVGEEAVAG